MTLEVFADLGGRHFLQFAQEIVGQLAQPVFLPQLQLQVGGEVGGHFRIGHGPVSLAGMGQAGERGEGAELVVGRRRPSR